MTTRHGKVLGYRRTRSAWGDGLEGFGMRQKMVRVPKGFEKSYRAWKEQDPFLVQIEDLRRTSSEQEGSV